MDVVSSASRAGRAMRKQLVLCGLLLCVWSLGGCGYGLKQAVKDARSVQPNERQKALNYLLDYVARTTGKEGNYKQRSHAIKALGATRLPRATGALRMVLQHETHAPLRQQAIRSLSKLKALSALQELRDALLQDKDLDTRMLAAAALGRVGDRRALAALIRALKDPQPAVRTAAIRSLLQLKANQSIPHLIDGLCDQHIDVRTASTNALLKMKKAALPWLLKELDFKNQRRRRCVVEFFPKMKSFALVPLIKAFAKKPKRVAATQALEKLTNDTATWPVFARILDRPDRYDGRRALRLLKKKGSLATVQAAFALWYNVPVRYRLLYRDLLGLIARKSGSKGRSVLTTAALSGPDLSYRCTAIIALGDLGASALPKLRSFLQSSTRAIVVSALFGLGKSGEDGLPMLRPYISSKDEVLRLVAMRAVGQIRTAASIPILMAGLKDSAAKIRMEALKGLARQRTTTAIPSIKKLMSDPIIDVSMTAIQTLISLGERHRIKDYIRALKRSPYPPKPAFVRTLSGLGDRRAIPVIKKVAMRYLSDWKAYRKRAMRLYRKALRRKRNHNTKQRRQVREQVKEKLKEHEAVNPGALCAFFEALQGLLRFNYAADQLFDKYGYQPGGFFNPLGRPVDQCPWPSLSVISTPGG